MLDKTSLKILKILKKKPRYIAELNEILRNNDLVSDCLKSLAEKKLIKEYSSSVYKSTFADPDGYLSLHITLSPYEITPDGIAYLEAHTQTVFCKAFKWLRNNILEIIAIIISIIALLKP